MNPYFTSSRRFSQIAGVLIVLSASAAEAQPKALVITSDGPSCEELDTCDGAGAECRMLREACVPTVYRDGSSRNLCVAVATVQYCCGEASDCPLPAADGGMATCVMTRDAMFGHGLCSYVDWDPCLRDSLLSDADLVRKCFEPPMGVDPVPSPYGIVPFALGDCDGDDTPNGTDPCVCDNSATCGMSGIDGGMTTTDAGAGPDASTNTMDAGELPPFDFGTADVDANLPPGTGLDFRGDGGCACEVGGVRATGTSGFAALLLTLSGLFAVRTRRRRKARIHAKADLRD